MVLHICKMTKGHETRITVGIPVTVHLYNFQVPPKEVERVLAKPH